MKSRPVLFLLTIAMTLVRCASSGQTLNVTPPSSKLTDYKNVVVHVTSSVPDSTREALQLESMIVSTLRANGVFGNVAGSSAGGTGDLTVDANISDLRRVGSGKRVLLGALAGRGNMVVDVKLVDTASGNAIGSFTSKGTSSGGTVFAGTTDQAIELAARQIVDYILKNR